MLLSPRSAALLALALAPALLASCAKDSASSSTGAASTGATAAPRRPAATATAAPASGNVCTFKGAWAGTYPPGPYPFSGKPFEITFNADGTGMTHSERADQEFAWKTEGPAFSIHSVKVEHGGRFACTKDEVGAYTYAFTLDCANVALKLTQDPCKGRALTMDGASLKRK